MNNSAEIVAKAAESWGKAPAHIRIMAGAYVSPLLEALRVLSEEVATLSQRIDFIEKKEKASNGNKTT